MSAFDFDISAGSASPIFRQIVDQVRLGVAMGRLAVGDQLPSVRALAEKLLVNPNTIAKAYTELARNGVIDGQQGRGVFIAPPRQIYTQAERNRRLNPLIESLVQEGISLGFSSEELLEKMKQKLAKISPVDFPGKKGS